MMTIYQSIKPLAKETLVECQERSSSLNVLTTVEKNAKNFRKGFFPVEQLDLLNLIEYDDLIQTRLEHVKSLLKLENKRNIEVIAINKHYEWSFLGKENGAIYSYHIYKKTGWLDLRKYQFNYSWERVLNRTLNFIAIT